MNAKALKKRKRQPALLPFSLFSTHNFLSMKNQIEKIINQLNLEPHPEGGFFKETYRSATQIDEATLGEPFVGARNISTGIYFLLTADTFSAFHKINQDEMWHFYDGSPLKIHMISARGEYSETIVGRNLAAGEMPQFTVPAGTWFGATVIESNNFSLVGCTVSPGFDFRDFQMPAQKELLKRFPKHRAIITALSRE